uniref:Sulfotransferase n=1 Tax=Leersia perrieri TaxID=77586 RepID=A0A0D9XS43_9ORYZ
MVDDVVELCSFDHLTGLEVNKTGVTKWRYNSVRNELFFRKGVAGDWSNHMSPGMAARVDGAVNDALRGTGFSFAGDGDARHSTHTKLDKPMDTSADHDVPGETTAAADVAALAPSLPLEARYPPSLLRQFAGFWLPEFALPGIAAAQSPTCFHPRPSDVFLASVPKSGTTWLKALAFATANRATQPPSSDSHPLRRCGPHDCFTLSYPDDGDTTLAALPSPRLLSTHLPYFLLPELVRDCRIVPKDTLVSWWWYISKNNMATSSYTIEDVVNQYCQGRCAMGPQWRHVIDYLEESRRRPEKVLFLRYEEMLSDPLYHVKKLANFLGCPFSDEEEKGGVVNDVVELCSFGHLMGLEVNRTGVTKWRYKSVRNESFFRKGVAGDWSNHMSLEMAARVDRTVDDALRETGFSFAGDDDSNSA